MEFHEIDATGPIIIQRFSTYANMISESSSLSAGRLAYCEDNEKTYYRDVNSWREVVDETTLATEADNGIVTLATITEILAGLGDDVVTAENLWLMLDKCLFSGWTVTVTHTGPGTIDPDGSVKAYHNQEKTFSILPSGGAHISDVVLNGSSIGTPSTVTITPSGNNTLSATFISTCTCYSTCYGYTGCSCDMTVYGSGCACNSTCYEQSCTCNMTTYSPACGCDATCYGHTCTCNNTTYGYVSCTCDNTCYGYIACTCDMTSYNYNKEACECFLLCYGQTACSCNASCHGYGACSCNATCYGQTCTCNAAGYEACTCDSSCYEQTCSCNATCYSETCSCDSACYEYTACSCDSACYGY